MSALMTISSDSYVFVDQLQTDGSYSRRYSSDALTLRDALSSLVEGCITDDLDPSDWGSYRFTTRDGDILDIADLSSYSG